jgi:molecular chaperone GrpE
MNDSPSNWESSSDASSCDVPPRDEVPQFGAVDIVEAFTAMRHEWRGQTKESRALAEQIQSAVTNLQSLEAELLARTANNRPEEPGDSKQLAKIIVETDHQLTRAIAALEQWEASRRLRMAADANAVERYFAGMSAISRWFARPLWTFIADGRRVQESLPDDPAIEGFNLVLARLRRAMNEQQIERLDTHGQAFDASTMHAIGTVASPECPSGHVAEQLSPGYRWQGQILRFADVRVAE